MITARIRLKYCGGCNPRYDRTAIATKLRADFPEADIAETSGDGPDHFVVIVCGCPVACASHGDLHGLSGKAFLTSVEDYGKVAAAVRATLLSRNTQG